MDTKYYNYILPQANIATHPPKNRGSSRLLVVDKQNQKFLDKKYNDIVNFLSKGDVLILNDTKVIKARLFVTKKSGVQRELIILEKHGKDDDWYEHKVLYRRKITINDELVTKAGHKIKVIGILGNGVALVKSRINLLDIAENEGTVPLPPYLNRQADSHDIERYQTVWANSVGSVAAPTASLNMTDQLLEAIAEKGVIICKITLHVGLGTFLPIRTNKLEEHIMHKEYFEIPKETVKEINYAKKSNNKIFGLGTTVARCIEYSERRVLRGPNTDISGEADIFIYPGYEFKLLDGLITNFHAPDSTVLMMVAAFLTWPLLLKAYEHAIINNYKFLSYGDSMLIY
jgi:S-adenosylmethionine:tRNA ribosyltransferase-isomerase